jgi:hypothetical protein
VSDYHKRYRNCVLQGVTQVSAVTRSAQQNNIPAVGTICAVGNPQVPHSHRLMAANSGVCTWCKGNKPMPMIEGHTRRDISLPLQRITGNCIGPRAICQLQGQTRRRGHPLVLCCQRWVLAAMGGHAQHVPAIMQRSADRSAHSRAAHIVLRNSASLCSRALFLAADVPLCRPNSGIINCCLSRGVHANRCILDP